MGAFADTIAAFAAKARGGIEAAVTEAAVEAGARLSLRSPVRTGRFRAAWRLDRGAGEVAWRNDTPYGPALERRRHFVRETEAEVAGIVAGGGANKS